jgi:hypothetical protein
MNFLSEYQIVTSMLQIPKIQFSGANTMTDPNPFGRYSMQLTLWPAKKFCKRKLSELLEDRSVSDCEPLAFANGVVFFCHRAVVFTLHFLRYCFREASHALQFQRSRPHLSKIIEFQAKVGYVKKISAKIVSAVTPKASDSPFVANRRTHQGPTAMELIYNYSHYMYGALWVADDSVDGEKGTVCCK